MTVFRTKYRLKEINIHETSLEGMFGKHSEAGYIIISAFRGGDDVADQLKQNLQASKQLKSDIRSTGYSFIPVWGGFIENVNTPEAKTVREQAYIVFNYKKRDLQPDSEELKQIGKTLCRKYKQESFLYKPTGTANKAMYINGSGSVIANFTTASPTQAADEYFTSLSKSRKKGNKKFTYREGKVYLAKRPETVAEAYTRPGEIYFNI